MTDTVEISRRQQARAAIRPTFDGFWNWLKAHTPDLPTGDMVEIGLGPNGFAPFYVEHFRSCIGLDVDDYRSFYDDVPKVKPVFYDGLNMPIGDNEIAFVASHSTFEHIDDVEQILREVDRILMPGGLIYITINPLYYSSWGSHGTLPDHQTHLPPWEHLNPESANYLTDCPPQMRTATANGCYLNKLTMSQLLEEVGKHPWSIMRLDRAYETMPLPPFIDAVRFNLPDVVTHDFRLLLRKDCIVTRAGVRKWPV